MLKLIKVIQHFESSISGKIYGIYEIDFNTIKKVFVRNGNEIFVISHNSNKQSLDAVRNDIAKEIIEMVDKQLPTTTNKGE